MLSKTKSGLPKNSVVNVSQLSTIDKNSLKDPIATLDRAMMQQIDDGLAVVLAL